MRKRKAEGDPRPAGVPRITPQDIQDKEFRLSFRGYNEREVDEFLDELTEAMAALLEENRRLRERVEAAASPLGREADEVLRRARDEADRILREAREEAERVLREAEGRAAAFAGPVGAEERRAIGAFVKREREFLQNLAALVQGHAEAVREMARRARERAEPGRVEAVPAGPAEVRPPAPTSVAPAAEETVAPRRETGPGGAPPDLAAARGPRPGEPGGEPTIRVPEAEPEPAREPPHPSAPTGRGEDAAPSETAGAAETPRAPVTDRPTGEPAGRDRGPSLRELFWGEE